MTNPPAGKRGGFFVCAGKVHAPPRALSPAPSAAYQLHHESARVRFKATPMAVDGLLQRARDAVIPEPIIFTVDDNRTVHFGTKSLPERTVIDVQLLTYAPWIELDEKSATVLITLDGRTVAYMRRGYDIHGRWICDIAR